MSYDSDGLRSRLNTRLENIVLGTDVAKDAMAAKDMEKCKMHMDNAMKGKSSM